MSAPDGDLERQSKHHRGPLRGMFAVVIFALILLGLLSFWAFGRGGDPEGPEAQVNDATGETVPSAEDTAGPSANDFATDDANAGTAPEADPSAVTVAPETVTAPQVGTGNPPDTDPGESQAAETPNPVTDESDATASEEESQNE